MPDSRLSPVPSDPRRGPQPDSPSGPGDHVLRWPASPPLTLHLTPERAVWWPAQRTLLLADMHVGKAAVFRAHGLPVPRGTTTATLSRLTQVVARTGAERLIVLGDFLHARESHAPATLAALKRWRDQHAQLHCLIVQGNHDRHAGPPPADLRFDTHIGPLDLGGLIGAHDAQELAAWRRKQAQASETTLALVGHVHPVVSLRNRLHKLRLPCYVLQGGVLTLPAFGDFTGGMPVSRREGQLFVVSEVVSALPPAIPTAV